MLKATVLAALALLALGVFAACGQAAEEEPTPPPPTATATPTPTPETPIPTPPSGGAGGGGGGTVVPIATPFPTPPPVPTDWVTYSDPDGRFTLRYPPTWFLQDGATSKVRPPGELTTIFYSFDPSIGGTRFPLNSLKVDLIVFAPRTGNDCRSPLEGATPAALGGSAGWERLISFAPSYDASASGVTRSHLVAAFHDGYCFSLTAYFAQDNPDEATFLQIVNSFSFK